MSTTEDDEDMLEDYDFSAGVRGKYVQRLAAGSNLVVIDPDVASIFPDHTSVNNVNADFNLSLLTDEIFPVFIPVQSKPTAPTRNLSFMR